MDKRYILGIIFLLAVVLAVALISISSVSAERTVKKEHPRLWLTEELMKDLQYKKQQNTADWQIFIGEADMLLGISGNRYYWKGDAMILALAYQVTKDEKYAARAKKMLEDGGTLTMDCTGNNQYRWGCWQQVIAFDWIYDYLEKKGETDKYVKAFHGWSDFNKKREMRYVDTDHLTSVARNLAMTAIATYYEDYPSSEEYLSYALDTLLYGSQGVEKFLLNGLAKGGIWPEGTDYNQGTLVYVYEMREAVLSG